MPSVLVIAAVPFAAAEELMRALDEDLHARYGPGEPVRVDPDEFTPPRGRMLLARWGGRPVGCAGVRPVPDPPPALRGQVAELKRMFVVPDARRRGVARALLRAGEQAAAELGYRQLWLETGTAQPEAVALYRSAGYLPVSPFGQYADAADALHLGRLLDVDPHVDQAS